MQESQLIIQTTKNWITSFIIPLTICPFAQHVVDNNTLEIKVSSATGEKIALTDLQAEIDYLNKNSGTETSLVIFPYLLQDFFNYLDFIEQAKKQILTTDYDGIYQFATFHPGYYFAEVSTDDVSNYTNRSPYPMIHILREESVEKAINFYGDTTQIPIKNIALLRQLGLKKIQEIIASNQH